MHAQQSGSISQPSLFERLTVDRLNGLDLSYTPPFGSPRDAVQQAARAWSSEWVRLAGSAYEGPLGS
jgi:hypothetical protein